MSGKSKYIKQGFLSSFSKGFVSLIRDLKEAIAGTDKDFTSIPLRKAILLLSIPMILEMLMESVFAVVDIFFVSKLGADAVATVGITESIMTLVYALGFGLSISTTALVSRRIGEKRQDLAAETAFQAILTGCIVSFLISVPGFIYPEELLGLMGASDEVISTGSSYTKISLGTNMVIMLLFIMNAVLRSSGDAASSMRVLFLANLINIVLDPCLIFGWGPFPELGIKGAAIATLTGRGVAVIYQFYILFGGKSRIKIRIQDIRLNYYLIWKLIKLSLGGIGQNIIATSSWIGMIRLIADYGSTVLAGYTIAIRIVVFSLLPSWGLANAAATLVGQNLGADRADRAEKSVWSAGFVNMALLGMISVVFIWQAEWFIRLFTPDAAVIAAGVNCLSIISAGFLLYGMGMVMVQAFNGAGDTSTPTWINLFCFWLLEIPLAYLLARPAGFDQQGVYLAIVIAESILAITAMVLFRKGTWKRRKV